MISLIVCYFHLPRRYKTLSIFIKFKSVCVCVCVCVFVFVLRFFSLMDDLIALKFVMLINWDNAHVIVKPDFLIWLALKQFFPKNKIFSQIRIIVTWISDFSSRGIGYSQLVYYKRLQKTKSIVIFVSY